MINAKRRSAQNAHLTISVVSVLKVLHLRVNRIIEIDGICIIFIIVRDRGISTTVLVLIIVGVVVIVFIVIIIICCKCCCRQKSANSDSTTLVDQSNYPITQNYPPDSTLGPNYHTDGGVNTVVQMPVFHEHNNQGYIADDGTIVAPRAAQIGGGGNINRPKGPQIGAGGTVIPPRGAQIGAHGTVLPPRGPQIGADGTVVAPMGRQIGEGGNVEFRGNIGKI